MTEPMMCAALVFVWLCCREGLEEENGGSLATERDPTLQSSLPRWDVGAILSHTRADLQTSWGDLSCFRCRWLEQTGWNPWRPEGRMGEESGGAARFLPD